MALMHAMQIQQSEAESIIMLCIRVSNGICTYQEVSQDTIIVTLPGEAREEKEHLRRDQVIAALEDNQVSFDELNMLQRVQEKCPAETIHGTCRIGLDKDCSVILVPLSMRIHTLKRKILFRSLTYADVLTEEEVNLLTQYTSTERIQETFESANQLIVLPQDIQCNRGGNWTGRYQHDL